MAPIILIDLATIQATSTASPMRCGKTGMTGEIAYSVHNLHEGWTTARVLGHHVIRIDAMMITGLLTSTTVVGPDKMTLILRRDHEATEGRGSADQKR